MVWCGSRAITSQPHWVKTAGASMAISADAILTAGQAEGRDRI